MALRYGEIPQEVDLSLLTSYVWFQEVQEQIRAMAESGKDVFSFPILQTEV